MGLVEHSCSIACVLVPTSWGQHAGRNIGIAHQNSASIAVVFHPSATIGSVNFPPPTRETPPLDFDLQLLGSHFFRLIVAAIAGGAIGFDREVSGQWAGLRTHMVVAIGAALFVMLGAHLAEGDPNATTRVVSGVATGVGFLGAGTILKLNDSQRIRGLTTASSIWMAAALGSMAGLARYEMIVAGTVMSLIVLVALRPVSKSLGDDVDEE